MFLKISESILNCKVVDDSNNIVEMLINILKYAKLGICLINVISKLINASICITKDFSIEIVPNVFNMAKWAFIRKLDRSNWSHDQASDQQELISFHYTVGVDELNLIWLNWWNLMDMIFLFIFVLLQSVLKLNWTELLLLVVLNVVLWGFVSIGIAWWGVNGLIDLAWWRILHFIEAVYAFIIYTMINTLKFIFMLISSCINCWLIINWGF